MSSDGHDGGNGTVQSKELLPDRAEGEPQHDEKLPLLHRRSYLRMGAAAVAALGSGTAAFSQTSEAAVDHAGITFHQTVNMVDDAGCDPTGAVPIDSALTEHADNDTLLEFPAGTYLVEQEHELTGVENFGIRGLGDSHEDVQFVFPTGYSGIFFALWRGRNWLVENITLQQSSDHETGVGIILVPYDNLIVRDFEVAGFSPWRSEGGQRAMYLDVLDPNGSALVDGFIRKGPAHMPNTSDNYSNGCQALLTDNHHKGTLTLRNCHIENASENGFYCSRGSGMVQIENCYFRNNDNSAVRISTDGSYIKDSTIEIDVDNAHPDNTGNYQNTRGLWVENKSSGAGGAYVENCEFIMKSTPNTAGLLHLDVSVGSFEVRDSKFYTSVPRDWSHLFIWLDDPNSLADTPYGVTFEGCSITAEGAGPAVDLYGRSGSVFSSCCVHGGGDGLVFHDADDCVIEDTNINVAGEAVVFDNSTADTRNITSGERCPLPKSMQDESSDSPETPTDTPTTNPDQTGSPDNTITIESTGGGVASYEFTVDGELQAGPDFEDTIDGSTATGRVGPDTGVDDYHYSGDITDFSLTGPANVFINGEQVDDQTLEPLMPNDESSGDDTPDTRELAIVSTGGGVAYYEFTVDGELQAGAEFEDTIDGSTATGRVGPDTGTDNYLYSGDITAFSLDGPANVFLDGEQVDPDTLAPDSGSSDGTSSDGDTSDGSTDNPDSPPHKLVIDGTGTSSTSEYSFTSTGVVEADETNGALESTDEIVDNSVSGSVEGDLDAFRFDGSIQDFTINGSATVTFAYTEETPVSTHPAVEVPQMVLSDNEELAAIKAKVDAGEQPWADAWSAVKSSADEALGVDLTSVVESGGGHVFQRDNDYQLAIRTKNRTRDLALAYYFTGDNRYARKAIDQLHRWFLDPDTYQEPHENGKFDTITQYITIPTFFYAADLLRGHAYWSQKSSEIPWRSGSAETPEAALAEWAIDWQETFRSPNCNNIHVWRAFARGVASTYADDDTVWDQALEEYRSDCTWNDFDDDGSFRYEIWRDNGYRYQLFRMKAHAMFCELGRVRGLNLYDEHDLKRAFDFMAPYVVDPDGWPHGTGSLDFDRNHEAGVYELAYSEWQDPTYLDLIESVLGRPVDEGRLLGDSVTLTHANRFEL